MGITAEKAGLGYCKAFKRAERDEISGVPSAGGGGERSPRPLRNPVSRYIKPTNREGLNGQIIHCTHRERQSYLSVPSI